jgi:hypothetical protein
VDTLQTQAYGEEQNLSIEQLKLNCWSRISI